jgi:regulator of cell morphogenesis and NO signaling
MEQLANIKVSKIVARNYRTAKVFTTHGIDFCCNGGIPLADACAQRGVDLDLVLEEVQAALQTPDAVDFESMRLPDLLNHIVTVHHQYVVTTIPVLRAYLAKLCRVHGERHPELFEIEALFTESALALLAHMEKEEQILFPYVRALADAQANHYPLSDPHFGHIQQPIQMMEAEHDTEGDRFRAIAELSDHYRAPADGCQTYRVAYAVLEEFEQDLHKHIHLENNILFPRAKALYESRLTTG